MAPLQERARSDTGRFARARRLLPIGAGLTPGIWQVRHRVICGLAWAHAVGVPLYGIAQGKAIVHSLLEGLPIALFALVASAPFLPRRARGAAASMALLTSSAILVHFSGGLIEMHFHFFVMVPIVALYQDWAPFGLAIGYVFVHHGMIGMLAPESVFNHVYGRAQPVEVGGRARSVHRRHQRGVPRDLADDRAAVRPANASPRTISSTRSASSKRFTPSARELCPSSTSTA